MNLYHYTCAHCVPHIRASGVIRAGVDIHGDDRLGAVLAWFTDLAPPVPVDAVGLTSVTLRCDRTEHVFTVDADAPGVCRWVDVRRRYRHLWDLEREHGAMPMHWFVSTDPIPITGELT